LQRKPRKYCQAPHPRINHSLALQIVRQQEEKNTRMAIKLKGSSSGLSLAKPDGRLAPIS